MTDLLVIIVGTNEFEYVRTCLRSLRASRTTRTLVIMVVDNASTDGTAEKVAAEFPEATVIRNVRKLGYIENNNRCMRAARSRYVLMLNADIELQPDTLETMLDFMDAHPRAAVSACRLVYEDGKLQLTCRSFPTPWTYISRLSYFFRWITDEARLQKSPAVRRYLLLDDDHRSTREVDWVLTAFFLMRRQALDEIGLLDECLVPPFYLEDVEWCFRARERGWQVFYVPEVRATHYYQRDSAKSFNRLSVVHMLNILIFFMKHGWGMLWRRHRRPPSGWEPRTSPREP